MSLYINIKDTVNLLTDDYYDTPTVIIFEKQFCGFIFKAVLFGLSSADLTYLNEECGWYGTTVGISW